LGKIETGRVTVRGKGMGGSGERGGEIKWEGERERRKGKEKGRGKGKEKITTTVPS
jgi:hypothetical protein